MPYRHRPVGSLDVACAITTRGPGWLRAAQSYWRGGRCGARSAMETSAVFFASAA